MPAPRSSTALHSRSSPDTRSNLSSVFDRKAATTRRFCRSSAMVGRALGYCTCAVQGKAVHRGGEGGCQPPSEVATGVPPCSCSQPFSRPPHTLTATTPSRGPCSQACCMSTGAAWGAMSSAYPPRRKFHTGVKKGCSRRRRRPPGHRSLPLCTCGCAGGGGGACGKAARARRHPPTHPPSTPHPHPPARWRPSPVGDPGLSTRTSAPGGPPPAPPRSRAAPAPPASAAPGRAAATACGRSARAQSRRARR